MPSAEQRGWGNPGAPGSSQERVYRERHLTRIKVAGISLTCRKEVVHLFVGFIKDLTAGGYALNVRADDWGYANRDVRGRPGVKSNHSWGLAIDLNATTNPMTNDGRNHSDLPKNVSALAKHWGLRWGGDYTGSRKDPMHFEYMGTPDQAQALRPKSFYPPKPALKPDKPAAPKKRHETNKFVVPRVQLSKGRKGDGVSWIQYQLKLKLTDVFDDNTVYGVKVFQKKMGLKPDGIVGSKTLAKLKTL